MVADVHHNMSLLKVWSRIFLRAGFLLEMKIKFCTVCCAFMCHSYPFDSHRILTGMVSAVGRRGLNSTACFLKTKMCILLDSQSDKQTPEKCLCVPAFCPKGDALGRPRLACKHGWRKSALAAWQQDDWQLPVNKVKRIRELPCSL